LAAARAVERVALLSPSKTSAAARAVERVTLLSPSKTSAP
jgi:hypothetical protein